MVGDGAELWSGRNQSYITVKKRKELEIILIKRKDFLVSLILSLDEMSL
jgi:hypothetical protein